MTAVALVQGASRGIGLTLARTLAARESTKVIATCRRPDIAQELTGLENVTVLKCDLNHEDDMKQVAEESAKLYGKLDFAINVSGILHPTGKGETKLADVTMQDLHDTFSVNTFGPLLMAKYLSPLLQKGNGLFGCQSTSSKNRHTGVLAHISARVGSISDNKLGGWYSYRMSKTALNMANKNISIELGRGKNKVVCLVLHPGTVETDLSRPYHKSVPAGKLFTAEYSANKMLSIINKASMNDTGKYLAWDGSEIPF